MLKLGQMTAMAHSSPNYKALVCVFLFGGNDGNNTIVPLDAARYGAYQTMRPNIALTSNVLLPVAAGGGQAPYGLHPRLTNLQRLYNQQKAAMAFNLGTLVQPTTKANLNSATLPRNLYSHSDETSQWQTANPTLAGGSGWGGAYFGSVGGIERFDISHGRVGEWFGVIAAGSYGSADQSDAGDGAGLESFWRQ